MAQRSDRTGADVESTHEHADRRRATGIAGEDAVAEWYAAHGYDDRRPELAGARRRDRRGRRAARGVVVFCEVKTRRGDAFGMPVEAVTARKQQRLRLLARAAG